MIANMNMVGRLSLTDRKEESEKMPPSPLPPKRDSSTIRPGPNENFLPPELRNLPLRNHKIARCDARSSHLTNPFFMKHTCAEESGAEAPPPKTPYPILQLVLAILS
jgi:hypothetical protein